MAFHAAHPFKVQTKLGEFTHFETGQTIPNDLMNSPYRAYILDHCAETMKPRLVVQPEMILSAEQKLRMAESERVKTLEKIAAKGEEPRKTVEPTSKLQDWKSEDDKATKPGALKPAAHKTVAHKRAR